MGGFRAGAADGCALALLPASAAFPDGAGTWAPEASQAL